jgi:hypothetical protein
VRRKFGVVAAGISASVALFAKVAAACFACLPVDSSVMASRITAEVRWITSRLSASNAAFPAYIWI